MTQGPLAVISIFLISVQIFSQLFLSSLSRGYAAVPCQSQASDPQQEHSQILGWDAYSRGCRGRRLLSGTLKSSKHIARPQRNNSHCRCQSRSPSSSDYQTNRLSRSCFFRRFSVAVPSPGPKLCTHLSQGQLAAAGQRSRRHRAAGLPTCWAGATPALPRHGQPLTLRNFWIWGKFKIFQVVYARNS